MEQESETVPHQKNPPLHRPQFTTDKPLALQRANDGLLMF
jgi:hypothetical protein